MKLCAVLAVVLATLVAQAQAANYIASVAYLTNPLPAGAIYVPEANRTAFLTLAELNQNVTTNYTLFNWELSYEPVPGGAVPIILQMVYYDPTQYPSNRQIISTIAADPNGLIPDTANTAGMFTLADLNAARASVGLPPAPICDPNNADLCGDAAPATLLQVANSTLYVLTFNDGAVITGFASLTPNITYPDPSPDDFYVGTFNGSYGLGNTPAMTGDNDVTFSIYNNFLPNQTWGMDVLSTFSNTTPNAKVTGISLVGINNGAPFQILNLTDRINLNDPNINGIGAHSDDAFTYPELTAAMRAAGLKNTTKMLAAVYTTDGNGNNFVNYMSFIPEWDQDPNAVAKVYPPPPPMARPSPTPKPKHSPPPKHHSPPMMKKSPPMMKKSPPMGKKSPPKGKKPPPKKHSG